MTSEREPLVESPAGGAGEAVPSEPRWPITVAVVTYIAISTVVRVRTPDHPHFGPTWLVPALEFGLLIALLAANQAQLDRRATWTRPLSIVLILMLAAMAIVSDCQLIVGLVEGSATTQKASSLLASGALIWLGTALVFSLIYWEFDSGGPRARFHDRREFPDFAFTQHLNPEIAPDGWRPFYTDYLALGFTTSTAFSPTDVMPLAHWAKLAMALQSFVSLTVIGLVIARAVNVFT
jgi:hypothetical protein